MQPEALELKVRQWSRKMHDALQDVHLSKLSEADFRRVIDPLLEQFCAQIGDTSLTRSEYTLVTGRADAVFNRMVIEYERPGKLKKIPDAATRHAIQQVKDYLEGLAKKERHQIERLAGVAFDGRLLIFVRYVNGRLTEETPVDVNLHSLERFLTWLAGLSSGIALTPENLTRDFAIEQLRTQNILRGLFRALGPALESTDGLVAKLFEQWRLFFSEAIDYSEAFGGRKLEPLKKWVRKAGFEIETPAEAEHFFFVLHTYFALLVKLLAWLALSRHLGGKMGAPSFASLTSADGETLYRSLQEMESGGIFRAYGILNLLEGDFFAWYLYTWNDKIEAALREIIKRLDEYDPTTLTLLPEETRDLFKKLYHYLLPREIRHNLGEYYTPDWLAQRLLVQVAGDLFDPGRKVTVAVLRQKVLRTRFLDPACGSGTFPILIIARMLELGRTLLVQESVLLESILHNVVGFDLNPLAVLTARVNYLLAIADLLEHRKGEVTIPIYLADSVRTPTLGEKLFSHDAYEFPTAVGQFLVPAVLCVPGRFDRFCDILENSLRADLEADSFIKRVEHEVSPSSGSEWGWDDRAVSLTRELYEKMLELHSRGMNGLWARLLKNNFAPLAVGQFDYIVGNPPWVNWEHLPDGYRDSTRDLWDRYQLAGTFRGGRPRLGAVKVDISALMTYTVMDTLLKLNGRLGFVITQSLFKTAGAGAGFRRFSIPRGDGRRTPLRILCVEDMVSLQPFEGASNRTAVMVLEKGKPTAYPVPYTVWRKQGRKRFTYDSTLEEVTNATVRLNFFAEPVNPSDSTSPWLTARPKVIRAIRKVLGKSDYKAHEGVNTGGANPVYWVEIAYKRPDGLVVVRNITEGAKVKVDEVTEPIEPDLLYPLLRGRDVQRWKAEPFAYIIVPRLHNNPNQVIPANQMQRQYPHTYGYLKRFEDVLLRRADAMVKSALERGEPFYFYGAVGTYTFAPWKVVWREQASTMTASVVGLKHSKPVVPDHKLMLVDCASEDEAHFVCASLNSSIGQMVAVSYTVEIQMDPHILEHTRIPSFDRKNPVHLRLADLSKQAHDAAKAGDETRLREIEAEIDRQAAKLWGLSDDELREIQQSLRELAGEEEPQAEEQP
jgi:SAM-dependent methyltransferase